MVKGATRRILAGEYSGKFALLHDGCLMIYLGTAVVKIPANSVEHEEVKI